MKKEAEILINGPRGQSFATVQVEEDGSIHPAFAEQALAHALNIYNGLEVSKERGVPVVTDRTK